MHPQLSADECRVIGVMVEKAQTTPGQYPMTLHAITTGCNQKSNRHPVVNLDEDRVLDALDGLRKKGLAVVVDMAGSRVLKYKHDLRQALGVSTTELVILAELWLRGPQTVGELRSRASRMHPLESLEVVHNVLDHLMQRDDPLVSRLAPAPGSRAERYAQLVCPDLHPLEAPTVQPAPIDSDLAQRVDQLESDVARLSQTLQRLVDSSGNPSL